MGVSVIEKYLERTSYKFPSHVGETYFRILQEEAENETTPKQNSVFSIDSQQARMRAAQELEDTYEKVDPFTPCLKNKIQQTINVLRESTRPVFVRFHAKDSCSENSACYAVELPDQMLASIIVYSGGGGLEAQETQVFISKREWGSIKELFLPQPNSFEFETKALKQALIHFENIIGKKAGTAHDIGGFEGNTLMRTQKQGQQDCLDEYHTTAQFIDLLERDNLLQHFMLDRVDPIAQTKEGPFHVGIKLLDPENNVWVLDTWFHNHGEAPLLLPFADWQQTISRGRS